MSSSFLTGIVKTGITDFIRDAKISLANLEYFTDQVVRIVEDSLHV
jgi:hypothetical protein